jgi:tRNA pseudouridine synthase 10
MKDRPVTGFENQLPVHHSNELEEKVRIEDKKEEDWHYTDTPTMSSFLEGDQEGDCWLCHDVFNSMEELALLTHEVSKDQEFTTFLIGCRINPGTNERERKIWEISEPSSAEPIKEELNREIGKIFADLAPDKIFDRKEPEVAFLVDPLFKRVEVSIKPIFIKGRYRKLVRGIPQTRWICRSCHGNGCERCGGKGKMYETSVEEIIGAPLLRALEGDNFKLHGMGREDVDVLTLGRGRPFIVEISSPKFRSLDLNDAVKSINEIGRGKVEVSDMVLSTRKEVPKVKEGSSMKRYRARLAFNEVVDKETLIYNISLLAQSPINQRTPRRVSHRRADKVRVRKVHEISAALEKDNTAVVDLLTDGGLYIKELFHGDEGRTDPSLASLLGIDVTVQTLDVTDVLDDGETWNDQG